jgi:hypothetical protein
MFVVNLSHKNDIFNPFSLSLSPYFTDYFILDYKTPEKLDQPKFGKFQMV